MAFPGTRAVTSIWRPALICTALLFTAACGNGNLAQSSKGMPEQGNRAYFIDPNREAVALQEVKAKRSQGQRVWCVPFARTLSGVELRGNAGTWWKSAAGTYDRGADPAVGSVMAFSSTRKMPMGHVAVVSQVVSPREILIDHANWSRNKVSLKMPVIDVSQNNDWSKVRVGNGSVYPVNGFIYPDRQDAAPIAVTEELIAEEIAASTATAVEDAIEDAMAIEAQIEGGTELPLQTASIAG